MLADDGSIYIHINCKASQFYEDFHSKYVRCSY